MGKTWIQSYTGQHVQPLCLQPETVNITDIARALSMKCRFTGHVNEFYSVAQHTVLGSHLVPKSFALAFLLHEVSEVYLPDIAKPIKPFCFIERYKELIPWEELEREHAAIIFSELGVFEHLEKIYSEEVKHMDTAMLVAEALQLKNGTNLEDWGISCEPAKVIIQSWKPSKAEAEFLNRYRELTGTK